MADTDKTDPVPTDAAAPAEAIASAAITTAAITTPAATPADQEAEPEPAIVDDAGAKLDRVLHTWAYGQLAGTPVGRSTEAWNALQNALPALRDAILKGD